MPPLAPKFPQPPRTPVLKRRGRAPGGLELRPLRGPAVDLPEDVEANRLTRWEAFRAHSAASYPEFICWEWLTKRKKLKPDVDFIFQDPILGGRTQFGGFVLDFYFPFMRMAWFIQGLQFHHTKPEDRARDLLATTIVSNRGILVIEIFEDDIFQREEYTLSRAFRGVQVSRRRA